MKSPQQWIEQVLSEPGKLDNWLSRQYVGECLAAERIAALADTQRATPYIFNVLKKVAFDEMKHAAWVKKLMDTRGLQVPRVSLDGTRYWEPILKNVHSFEELCALGHHAEAMRLIRIELIKDDIRFDKDIRETFTRIFKDEQMHVKAFKALTTKDEILKTAQLHQAGLNALGLEI
jgi:rubrerythrin